MLSKTSDLGGLLGDCQNKAVWDREGGAASEPVKTVVSGGEVTHSRPSSWCPEGRHGGD